jgi:hypothetical protein
VSKVSRGPLHVIANSELPQVGDGVRGGQRALGEHHPPDGALAEQAQALAAVELPDLGRRR